MSRNEQEMHRSSPVSIAGRRYERQCSLVTGASTTSGSATPPTGEVVKRPRSVTVIGYLFIAVGIVGIVYHAADLTRQSLLESDAVLVLLVRLLAIVAGVFILRGANWARWLALAWLGFHVILSAFNSFPETLMHLALSVVIAYVLLRPGASAYFRATTRPSLGRPKP